VPSTTWNREFSDLLLLFSSFKVRYLVIGGQAVIYYTEPRYTKDLDLWIDRSKQNAKKAYAALVAFGAPVKKFTPEDLTEPDVVIQIGAAVRIDVLTGTASNLPFTQAWKRRRTIRINNVTVHLISKKDLIRLKEAAGRPVDLVDLQSLRGES